MIEEDVIMISKDVINNLINNGVNLNEFFTDLFEYSCDYNNHKNEEIRKND